jgi:hypothetical protein
MSQGVFTDDLRIQWVKGWLTGGTDPEDGSVECGDYTAFPLEVTGINVSEKLDKIAEIFYRASIAQITENNLQLSTSQIGFGVTAGAISPRVMYSAGEGLSDNYLMSGYYSLDDEDTAQEIYAAALPYFGAQYTEEYESGIGSPTTGNFRDLAENERGIWLPFVTGSTPIWNQTGTNCTTAFDWYSHSAAGTFTQPSIPIPWVTDDSLLPDVIYESFTFSVATSGKIGVIYGGAAGALFHPDNRFFIGLQIDSNISGFSYNIRSEKPSGYDETDAIYTMRLSSGNLSCPLATNATDTLTGEIVHEVVEWFPYAKDSPATPVWNTATGLPI